MYVRITVGVLIMNWKQKLEAGKPQGYAKDYSEQRIKGFPKEQV